MRLSKPTRKDDILRWGLGVYGGFDIKNKIGMLGVKSETVGGTRVTNNIELLIRRLGLKLIKSVDIAPVSSDDKIRLVVVNFGFNSRGNIFVDFFNKDFINTLALA